MHFFECEEAIKRENSGYISSFLSFWNAISVLYSATIQYSGCLERALGNERKIIYFSTHTPSDSAPFVLVYSRIVVALLLCGEDVVYTYTFICILANFLLLKCAHTYNIHAHAKEKWAEWACTLEQVWLAFISTCSEGLKLRRYGNVAKEDEKTRICNPPQYTFASNLCFQSL